jgi:hypothetical protein
LPFIFAPNTIPSNGLENISQKGNDKACPFAQQDLSNQKKRNKLRLYPDDSA